jgi:Ca2+/H+ antiporter, TMEM165/GDT1 family
MNWISFSSVTITSFLASLVEFIEALTIILAVGATRSWRAALQGALAGLIALILLVSFFGNSIQRIPLHWMQLGIGALVTLFGLKWLKKATLRSAGRIPLHDEELAYSRQVEKLQTSQVSPLVIGEVDLIGVGTTFKAVLLEGVEVVFIVVTAGGVSGHLTLACVGAAAAFVLVTVLGVFIHRPLSRVPENTLKRAVGILLSALGVFWVGEGLGYEWPQGDFCIVFLALLFWALSLTASNMLKIDDLSHEGEGKIS